MPAGLDPITPYQNSKIVVHVQRLNRRSPAHRPPDDFRAILTPPEMALPLLSSGIEETYPPACHRITTMRFVPFVAVAQRTRQPQVVLIIAAAKNTRFDMLDLQFFVDVLLMGQTIATAMAGLLNDARSYL